MIQPLKKIDERDLVDLPGADMVLAGLKQLREGKPGEFGLLVLIAGPRLKPLGLDIPDCVDIPRPMEHELYSRLELTRTDDAFSYYNALLRTMASFAAALEHFVR